VMNVRRKRATWKWRPGPEYRVICSCQLHARKRERWRRALRLVSRGMFVIAAPIAFTLFDIPTRAMNFNLVKLHPQTQPKLKPGAHKAADPRLQRGLSIFTTDMMSEQFISANFVRTAVTVDSVKEQFFRKNVPYGSIIYREARRNGLAPELVAAMVHTESDFRPGLVSHKSAQGLMQIVPDTARDLGLSNVFDPAQNIAAGTRYFRYLLDRFENDRLALAAYNAGEGKVERCNCVPEISETLAYVDKVNVRASRYRQRVQNDYIATLQLQPEH
jgi:hypothetical protein